MSANQNENVAPPLAESELTVFIAHRLAELEKTSRWEDIARAAGYTSSEHLRRIAIGEARVQLDHVPPLAKGLSCDPGLLLGLGCGDHWTSRMTEVFAAVLPRHGRSDADQPTSSSEMEFPADDQVILGPATQRDNPLELQDSFNLNFKVRREFRRAFRLEAARRGLSLKALLEECFESYLSSRS